VLRIGLPNRLQCLKILFVSYFTHRNDQSRFPLGILNAP
jgi:hypothetical protein